MEIFCSVLNRKRSLPSNLEPYKRYVNYSASVVDGVVKLTPSPVVSPALAEASSVLSNALTNKERVPLRSRKNVDAVDLQNELNKLV